MDLSPDGKLVAFAGCDGHVQLWSLESKKLLLQFDTGERAPVAITAVTFAPNGKVLATGHEGSTVRTWDLTAEMEKLQLVANKKLVAVHTKGLPRHATGVVFSPDGKSLVAGCPGWRNQVWDPETGQEKTTWKVPTADESQHWVRGLAFSPNGQKLAAFADGGELAVLETANGRLLATMSQEGVVLDVAWTPDGKWLASVGGDKHLRFWDPVTGKQKAGMMMGQARDDWVFALAFSPDGTKVALAVGNVVYVREVAKLLTEKPGL
jgi:WD40 repeat protein